MDVRRSGPAVSAPRRVDQPRRWAAFRCFGVVELLLDVHASYEDLVGALNAGQLAVARYAAREIVLRTLAVRAVLADGLPPDVTDPLVDPFAGVSGAEVAESLGLIRAVARATDIADARRHLDAIEAYVRRLEADLGYAEKAPSVRRPEGLFPAVRVIRQVLPINRAAHLPIAMPSDWLAADTTPGSAP